MNKRALVIDDEPDIRQLLSITLKRMQIDCFEAENIASARRILRNHTFDLCLTDMILPDGNGIDLVREMQSDYSNLPVAVITAYGNVETAVDALKAGAFDFIAKPVNVEQLRNIVNAALKTSTEPKPESTPQIDSELLGESTAMLDLKTKILKIARSQSPIYIRGETGVGKELVARLIHRLSGRHDGAWIPINCGAIPHELMESEFFGHLKGSFTGAHSNKAGLFEAASGGTLFLDEIAELPLSMQVKLLRAIQERKIKRVGSTEEIAVDVRIVSATHHNLSELVAIGSFRNDLFYRINVIELPVPPLRERLDDIPILSNSILKSINQINTSAWQLSRDANDKLMSYAFPGNVRELENILERACTLSESETLSAEDLDLPNVPDSESQDNFKPGSIPLDDHLAEIEKQALMDAMDKCHGNKTAAAELLGISFRTIRYKVKKYQL
ncbi:MAG: two-component system response regulator PilR (NtrC family) [Gammaproteobacteria bacterium]|jgi:two-component system response regulator PilR (NtrC family)